MRFFTTVVAAAVVAIALPAQAAKPVTVSKCIEAATKRFCESYPLSLACREGRSIRQVVDACKGQL